MASKRKSTRKGNLNVIRKDTITRPPGKKQVATLGPAPLIPKRGMDIIVKDPLSDFSEKTGASFG